MVIVKKCRIPRQLSRCREMRIAKTERLAASDEAHGRGDKRQHNHELVRQPKASMALSRACWQAKN